MNTVLSTLKGSAVLSNETKERLGAVEGVLIHPKTFQIEGFYVQVPTFFTTAQQFVPTSEVVRIGTALLVRSNESLTEDTEIFRLQPILENFLPIVRAKTFTAQGVYKGRVVDVQFSTSTCTVLQIVVQRWLQPHQFFTVAHIDHVTKKGIVLRDNKEPVANAEPIKAELTLPVLQET